MPGGDEIVPVLNHWIAGAHARQVPVVATRDWHPVHHVSFSEQGGPWPVHCVQDTKGAEFHPDLDLPADAIRVSKGTRFDEDAYSAFQHTGLASFLRSQGVQRLWVGGLAQDVCVLATVTEGCAEGFEVHVILDATRPVDEAQGAGAIDSMREAGAIIEERR